jgi:hypothetical protein
MWPRAARARMIESRSEIYKYLSRLYTNIAKPGIVKALGHLERSLLSGPEWYIAAVASLGTFVTSTGSMVGVGRSPLMRSS